MEGFLPTMGNVDMVSTMNLAVSLKKFYKNPKPSTGLKNPALR